jgi:Family of unknown function (DUF5677)
MPQTFRIGDQQIDKEKWEGIEKEIKDSCGEEIFNEIKKYGFSGISLAARAVKTGDTELYDFAYRLYSRSAHAMDILEQVGDIIVPDAFPRQQETLLPAVLQASCRSGRAVVEGANDWLGNPLGIK